MSDRPDPGVRAGDRDKAEILRYLATARASFGVCDSCGAECVYFECDDFPLEDREKQCGSCGDKGRLRRREPRTDTEHRVLARMSLQAPGFISNWVTNRLYRQARIPQRRFRYVGTAETDRQKRAKAARREGDGGGA